MKHLIDIKDLSTEEIDELINVAKDIMNNRQKYAKIYIFCNKITFFI